MVDGGWWLGCERLRVCIKFEKHDRACSLSTGEQAAFDVHLSQTLISKKHSRRRLPPIPADAQTTESPEMGNELQNESCD